MACYTTRSSCKRADALNVRSVDPRDIDSEVTDPTYRVYFWRRYDGGYASRECEVSGADNVLAVLAWADENAANDETHVIYVVDVARSGEKCLFRLIGADPTLVGGG